jgi:hypothetical protein
MAVRTQMVHLIPDMSHVVEVTKYELLVYDNVDTSFFEDKPWESSWIVVGRYQNQMLVDIRYEAGSSDCLELMIQSRQGEDAVAYTTAYLCMDDDGMMELREQKMKVVGSKNVEYAVPVCGGTYMRVVARVIGDMAKCKVGVRVTIGNS